MRILIVEFTPQTYVGGDLDLFFKYEFSFLICRNWPLSCRNFSSTQVGTRPQLVSIDGG